MSDCIFCRIAAGEIPARKVHDDADYVVFEDLNPQAPIHLLLIPRRHIESLSTMSPGDALLLGGLLDLARRLAEERGVAEKGWRLVSNSGADGGQSVFHLHFHLLGGRPLGWPPG